MAVREKGLEFQHRERGFQQGLNRMESSLGRVGQSLFKVDSNIDTPGNYDIRNINYAISEHCLR